jgi:tetratricopeptide (TPR) repeat protein
MIVLVLLAAAAAVARPTPPPDPSALLAKAARLHQSGQLDEAIEQYRRLLAAHPDHVPARSNLGAALVQGGHYPEAIAEYRKALDRDESNVEVRVNLALAFYKAQRLSEAAAELERVVSARPQHPKALILLADCRLRLGQFAKVIEILGPLESAADKNQAIAYLLGVALIKNDQPEKGKVLLDRILSRDDSAEARLMLGTAYYGVRDYAAANEEFARAARLDPRLPSVHLHHGRTLMAIGSPEEAAAAFRRELAREANDFDSNLLLGALLKQEQGYEEARRCFDRALRVRPGALEVRYQLGSLKLLEGDADGARQILEDVTKKDPRFLEAYVSLATAYYRLQRKADGDRARAQVEKLTREQQEANLAVPAAP